MKTTKSKKKTNQVCRISGEKLVPLFTLGDLYMSDFVKDEPKLPKLELKLMLAPKSGLVQLEKTPNFDAMYREYWYASGTNQVMKDELQDIVVKASKYIRPGKGDAWLDIGCNDGTLLSFVNKDIYRIGFDPAKNGYKELSQKHADKIVEDYFTFENWKKAGLTDKKVKVVTSIGMFYDLPDPNKFVRDIKNVMDREGLWVIQMSYTPLMLEQMAFDNICHEHLEYYNLSSVKFLMERNGMEIVDCELNDVNGGSFRIYIRNKNANKVLFATAPQRSVADFRVKKTLKFEKDTAQHKKETYLKFYKEINKLKKQTMDFIKKEKKKGKTIWAQGASTKGNTLLQWFGLNDTHIDAISERQERKFGLKTAGTNIPIKSREEMRKAKPDYVLVLPWHFIGEIVQDEQDFLDKGGAFIVPCPKFEIIKKNNK